MFQPVTYYEEKNKRKDFCVYNYDSTKENVCIYSNCHGVAISQFLYMNNTFKEQYNIFLVLCYLIKLDHTLIESARSCFESAHIILCQDVYKNDPYLSTSHMTSVSKARKIVYFANPQNNALYIHKHPFLRSWVVENSIENINEFQQQAWDTSISISITKEASSDVKIHDYIMSTYQLQRSFIDKYHPTTHIFFELTNRILGKLQYEPNSTLSEVGDNLFQFSGQNDTCHCTLDVSFFKLCYVQPDELARGDKDFVSRVDSLVVEKQLYESHKFSMEVWE